MSLLLALLLALDPRGNLIPVPFADPVLPPDSYLAIFPIRWTDNELAFQDSYSVSTFVRDETGQIRAITSGVDREYSPGTVVIVEGRYGAKILTVVRDPWAELASQVEAEQARQRTDEGRASRSDPAVFYGLTVGCWRCRERTAGRLAELPWRDVLPVLARARGHQDPEVQHWAARELARRQEVVARWVQVGWDVKVIRWKAWREAGRRVRGGADG